ncbi:hypothetical protein FDP41_005956 [Naegleria fowleri]|uniref:Uncharacterized protein n=1 Tax=Naegleria fowleri TaxID=5763 RepID=A0A6A5BB55_NAEFO|nr:uncharacterized protein FDP41_005956 [Naegleria fowleri]KAF0975203.1 hypothetical protein FDP41_005956 [Naegleria fowleri]
MSKTGSSGGLSSWFEEKIEEWSDQAYDSETDEELCQISSKQRRKEIKKERFLAQSEKTITTVLGAVTSIVAMIYFSKYLWNKYPTP